MFPFALRNRLRWPGRPWPREQGFAGERPMSARALELFERYGLDRWEGEWERGTLDEVLGTLDLLDRFPALEPPRRLLDVGAKNWRYLGALAAWLERQGAGEAGLDGVELDAYRFYGGGYTRASAARYYIGSCERVLPAYRYRYLPMDAADYGERTDLITWFLPFVLPGPHRAWGLPGNSFRPGELFELVAGRLRPKGRLLMVNQGEWEWEEASRLLRERTELRVGFSEAVEGSLHASSHTLFLSRWTS